MQLDFDFKINGQNIILKNFGSFEKYGLRAALKYYCNELLKSDVLKNISLSDIVETPNSVKSILVSKLNEIQYSSDFDESDFSRNIRNTIAKNIISNYFNYIFGTSNIDNLDSIFYNLIDKEFYQHIFFIRKTIMLLYSNAKVAIKLLNNTYHKSYNPEENIGVFATGIIRRWNELK